MFWVIQLAAALTGITLAFVNKWAVILLRLHIPQENKKPKNELHFANSVVKAIFCAVAANRVYPDITLYFCLYFVLLWLIIWLFFDPVLNLFTGKPWNYLGTEAYTDNLVKNGKLKAIFCTLFIIGLNLVLKLQL